MSRSNCPPQQAGCPPGPQYPQGAALVDLSNNNIRTMPHDVGHVHREAMSSECFRAARVNAS
jgi:hypothetical protein